MQKKTHGDIDDAGHCQPNLALPQRVRPSDLESTASRARFVANLPPWLFGTYGGNSACIEARLDDNNCIILDAGSGIRELASALMKEPRQLTDFHIFITHFHYDHLQGLPFFGPAYNPNVRITFFLLSGSK